MAVVKARLAKLNRTGYGDDFFFSLNPSHISRSIMPHYVQVPVANADYFLSDTASTPPFQWTGNTPEEIRIEFLLDAVTANTQDVEAELLLLDQFMRKSSRTGEPPNLLFFMGYRSDLVRIFSKDVEEKLHDESLNVVQAVVRLTMRTFFART